MANELGLKLNLKYKKNDRTFSINEESSITVAGDDYTFQRQSIGFGNIESLDIGSDIGTQGYLYIKNRDSTNFVLIGKYVYKLAFDGQTVGYAEGTKITGGTSGATGWIVYDEDDGATGTLVLSNVVGTFQNDEAITSGSSDGYVNGTISTGKVAFFMKLKAGEFAVIRVTKEDSLGLIADTAACDVEYFIIED